MVIYESVDKVFVDIPVRPAYLCKTVSVDVKTLFVEIYIVIVAYVVEAKKSLDKIFGCFGVDICGGGTHGVGVVIVMYIDVALVFGESAGVDVKCRYVSHLKHFIAVPYV